MHLGYLVSAVIVLIQHARAQPGNIPDETLTFEYPYRPSHVNYPEHDLFVAGVHVHNVQNVVFHARGKNDAHVLLKKERDNFNDNVVELVLGGWSNSKSVIRDRQQGTPKDTFQGSVLSETQFNVFWTSWIGNCIKVGVGHRVGESEKMAWCGLTHGINYISASFGFGSGGTFQFLQTAQRLTYYHEYRPNAVNYPKHDLFADGVDVRASSSVAFTTKGRNDAHVLLKRDRYEDNAAIIEVVLGGWSNSKSVIRDRQQGPNRDSHMEAVLSPTQDRPFWISWADGCVKVGKGFVAGKSGFLSWCGLSHEVNYVSASYGFRSDGYFTFMKTADAPLSVCAA